MARTTCDTINHGFGCNTKISRSWGPYTPYFSVSSSVLDTDTSCKVVFSQVLHRHGARYPTTGAGKQLKSTIEKIQANATAYNGKFAFIRDFNYTLGADQLNPFGTQEMINSGIKFAHRYKHLTSKSSLFVRASSEQRVVDSATNFTKGFNAELGQSSSIPVLTISEADDSNNTLNHALCTSFETGIYSTISSRAEANFTAIFAPNITARLNRNLPGAYLTNADTVNLMTLCPFETENTLNANTLSAFCKLFTTEEWTSYNYLQTIGKYYGFGPGNPLGPTQGVGFTNELIARLTGTSVADHTSTNRTLDSSSATFPLNLALYADFTHDDDMIGIFSALGLFDHIHLPVTAVQSLEESRDFSASTLVPFAARMYVEKLICHGRPEPSVRIVINDQVTPLPGCNSDVDGLCLLSCFVDSLGFAKSGGRWHLC